MLWRRLRRNCASKNKTIGLTSSAPKSGNNRLTGFNSGSCIRDKTSIIIRTTGCQGLIILNVINQPIVRYDSNVQMYMLIIWSISIANAYMKTYSAWCVSSMPSDRGGLATHYTQNNLWMTMFVSHCSFVSFLMTVLSKSKYSFCCGLAIFSSRCEN